MYEDNKWLRGMRKVYVVLFAVAVCLNVFLSSTLGFMNFIAIAIMLYGVLGYLGYVKRVESKEQNRIVYSTSVPILPIVFIRIAQFLLGKFLHVGMKDSSLVPFFACCFADILLLMLAIMDSGSYYYEGIIEDEQEDPSIVTVESKER